MQALTRALLLACLLFFAVHVQHVRAEDAVEADGDIDADVAAETAPTDEKPASEQPDDQEYDEEDEESQLSSSPDMETSFIFPDYPDKKLPLGERVKMLVTFANKGSSVFKVTHMGASLHSRYDYSYFIQNFTAVRFWNVDIGPSQEGSAEYTFQTDETLEPLEFWFSAFVLYNSSTTTHEQQFVSTVYNGTIELVERPTPVDATQIFKYLVGLGGAGAAVYFYLNSQKSGGKKRSSTQETGTRTADEIEIYKPAPTSKAFKKRKPSKSPSKSKSKSPSSGAEADE